MNQHDTNHFNRRKCLYGAGGSMLALPWLETVAAKGATTEAEGTVFALRVVLFTDGFCERSFLPQEG